MTDRRKAIEGVRTRRGRQFTLLLALTGLVAGIVIIGIAGATQRHASQPAPGAWGTVATSTPTRSPSPAKSTSSGPSGRPSPASKGRTATARPSTTHHRHTAEAATGRNEPTALPPSKPDKINIPSLGIDSAVFAIGKDAHGGLQVPQPGPHLNDVAWYRGSPTPGQTGPAVLEGHVDTVNGPSVFLHLGALTPGDKINIGRSDGTTAVFTVNAVRDYASHSSFPTDLVYGGDLSSPTLRIITCSNFDRGIGHYVGNTIVFAHLTGVRH